MPHKMLYEEDYLKRSCFRQFAGINTTRASMLQNGMIVNIPDILKGKTAHPLGIISLILTGRFRKVVVSS